MGRNGPEVLETVAADLHVHTCLSPCATLDMTPTKIVHEACKKGLRIIAITDHNSAENAGAVVAAARDTGLWVIPGIEVTSTEEAHIVGLFSDTERAFSMQELIYETLQKGENKEELFGIQVVANELDEVESINKRILIGATDLSSEEVVQAIHDRGGLAVAAHIDRQSFSIVSQLGFIPDELSLDAIEISSRMRLDEARKVFEAYDWAPFITASDAHDLEEVGTSPTWFRVGHRDMPELRLALAGVEGRKIIKGNTESFQGANLH